MASLILTDSRTHKHQTQQYTSIQILRGFAALMVVFYHMPSALGLNHIDIPVLNSGVDLFFVISGLVMVLSTKDGRHDQRTFLMLRFTRIIPLYWIMTFFMAAAITAFAGRAVSLEEIIKSLLFIPYLDTATGFVQPVLGVGWTLNLEILFYTLFAATMTFGALRQIAAIGALFALAVIARVVLKPADTTVLFFYTSPILFEFLGGMVLGHLVGRLEHWPASLSISAVVFAVASALVMRLGFDLPRTVAQGIPAMILVAGCVGLDARFQRFAPSILSKLGDASYSLYLTHTITLLAITPVVARTNVSPWIAGGVIVMVCVVVSLASYAFIEKPLLIMSRMSVRTIFLRRPT